MVEHGLGHIQSGHAGLLLQLLQTDDKLMHAGAIISQRIDILQLFFHIVGIQYGIFSCRRYSLATDREDVRQRLHRHQEVAAERAHVSDALRTFLPRQILGQERLAAARAASRTAAAVRCREGLVQIHMDHVKAHVARARDAHDRVQIGAVIVAKSACFVDDARDLEDIRVEKSNGVRVGQHQAGGIFADSCFKCFQIHAALIVRSYAHHLKTCHRRAGGVGSVGGIGHDDLCSFQIAFFAMICLDQQKAGKFAMCAGCGLKRNRVHAGDLAEIFLQRVADYVAAFNGIGILQRVDAGEARKSRCFFVDLRIIFHCARAEGIKSVIYAVGLLGQLGVVAVHFGLGQLGQSQCRFPSGCVRDDDRHIAFRNILCASSGSASFKYKLHAPVTSLQMEASKSISSFVFISVAHQRILPSPRGRPPRIPASARASRIILSSSQTVTNSWKNSLSG